MDPDAPAETAAECWPLFLAILEDSLRESLEENAYLAAQILQLRADLAEARKSARAGAPTTRPIRYPFPF